MVVAVAVRERSCATVNGPMRCASAFRRASAAAIAAAWPRLRSALTSRSACLTVGAGSDSHGQDDGAARGGPGAPSPAGADDTWAYRVGRDLSEVGCTVRGMRAPTDLRVIVDDAIVAADRDRVRRPLGAFRRRGGWFVDVTKGGPAWPYECWRVTAVPAVLPVNPRPARNGGTSSGTTPTARTPPSSASSSPTPERSAPAIGGWPPRTGGDARVR